MDAITVYSAPSKYPKLTMMQHVIIRAVKALPELEALALIRGAYADSDGAFATLADAKQIYRSIMLESRYHV